jgi:hypothetical protein
MTFSEINFVEVLLAASKSPLGIIALVILAMSVVGVILFRNSKDSYKFGVFIILLLGIVSFTYASLQIVQPPIETVYNTTSKPNSAVSTTTPNDALLLDQGVSGRPSPEIINRVSDSPGSTVDNTIPDNASLSEQEVMVKQNSLTIVQQAPFNLTIMPEIEEGFIYLGTYRNGSWVEPRFIGASGELQIGDIITLSESRKMFECAPYRKSLFSFNYTYCNDVIGNVDSEGKVEVLKTPVSVGLNRIWVYVKETN